MLFNQPDAPVPEKDVSKVGGKKRQAEGPPPPPSPPPPPVNPGKDENNVGNKLLKMMGWTEGTGLGTDGEGRVDPMFVLFLGSAASFTESGSVRPLSTPKVSVWVQAKAKTLPSIRKAPQIMFIWPKMRYVVFCAKDIQETSKLLFQARERYGK